MSAAGRRVEADPPFPADALEVGRIVDAWGIKGWIKVHPFSADPQALLAARRWHLRPADDARPAPRPPGSPASPSAAFLQIAEAKLHGDAIVALPRGHVDRAAAEALRGARIFIGRSEFPAADPDEFYWVDLIGLDVVNRDGVRLGTVAGLLDTGPHSVLQVAPVTDDAESLEQAERLIPFVAAYVDDVDLAARRITVDWGTDY